MSKSLPIHEVFHAFQGEGVHMGRSAFFIRTFGCPVHCPWCDSAGTWHKDHIPKDIQRMTGVAVADLIPEEASFAVITGGEPLAHDLDDLINAIHRRGFMVHLETSGALPFRGLERPDWITLSPKRYAWPSIANLHLADELKIIVEQPDDIMLYLAWLIDNDHDISDATVPIWLHPEWSKNKDPEVLNAISDFVKKSRTLRAGYQLHKLYQVDSLDGRSRPLVPLGGDPSRGF